MFVLFCFVVVVWCVFFLQFYTQTHVNLLNASLTKCPDKWIIIYTYFFTILGGNRFGNWMVLCVTTCLKQMCWMRRLLSPTIWKFQLAWLSVFSPLKVVRNQGLSAFFPSLVPSFPIQYPILSLPHISLKELPLANHRV